MKIFLILTMSIVLLFTACRRNNRGGTPHPPQINPDPVQNGDYDLSKLQKEPYYKYAWHFAHNEEFANQYNIDSEASIHIEGAWKITRGENVTVAVIDASNFDYNHEDLKSNVIRIYNADEDNNHISNQGDSDKPSHGSTVAGFIASPINGRGLVGAAPDAKLILIKQLDSSDSATISAFDYAAKNGAKVINCSWGTGQVSQAVAAALQELKDKGVTIIFASGNDGENLDYQGVHDESELPSVIGLGASDEFNDIASYSNYGENLDLIAPGGNINNSAGILGLDDSGSFGGHVQRDVTNNNYSFVNGTSFSAPITAGVVALMISANPNLTPYQVREILIKTADKIGYQADYKNGFDRYRAYGKINATKAVTMAKDY